MNTIKKFLSWWTRSERESRKEAKKALLFQRGKAFAEQGIRTIRDKKAAIERLEDIVDISRLYGKLNEFEFDRGIIETIREFRIKTVKENNNA